MHHAMGLLEKARMKFSVPSEKSIVRYMTLMRSLGFGIFIAIRLPTAIATPEQDETIPKTLFPPLGFGMMSAGRVALNADAIRLTPDKKRITYKIIGFCLRYLSPSFASWMTFPGSFLSPVTSGIFIKHARAMYAIANVIRSTAIAASSPASP